MTFNIAEYNKINSFIEKNSKETVKIIAVSKNHPISSIEKALSGGVRIFGENRVQEAINKFNIIKTQYEDLELHLTGSLQTNKVKQALEIFDTFQTLDRVKLAREFSKYPNIIKNKLFFVQINTGAEINKSGISLEEANKFIKYCKFDLKINVVGLMCIPPVKENPTNHFNLLKKIAFENNLFHLSMGMSSDYKEGVLSGATYVRVGTKLFGSR